jgi:hypothetical protein
MCLFLAENVSVLPYEIECIPQFTFDRRPRRPPVLRGQWVVIEIGLQHPGIPPPAVGYRTVAQSNKA